MADALAGEPKTSLDVFEFEVGMLTYNLFRTHAIGKQLQNVAYSNPHAPDTGPSAALLSVDSDSFKDLHHKLTSRPRSISQAETLGYHTLLGYRCLTPRSETSA